MRQCPNCAEQIEDDATTCPFCHSSLAERAKPQVQESAWAVGPAQSTPAVAAGMPPRGARTWIFVTAAVAVVAVLALVVYVAGRSTDDPAAGPTAGAPASLEPGWTLVTETEDGFAVGLPEGWEESQFDVGESIKFQAIDATDSAAEFEFVPNLNVIAQPLPFELSLDDYIQANLSQLETQLQGVTDLSHQRISLPVGATERIQYRFELAEEGGPQEISVVQYVFIRERTGYILTFETAPPQFDRYRPTFERMASTFRFTT